MTINWDKPLRTKAGAPARLLGVLAGNEERDNYIVAVMDDNGDETSRTYYPEGDYYSGEASSCDLINIPEKKSGWLNIYGQVDASIVAACHNIFASKQLADACAVSGRVACIFVEWEEKP